MSNETQERRTYLLTQELFDEMVCIAGSGPVTDPDAFNAGVDRAWDWLGEKLGFDWKTTNAGDVIKVAEDPKIRGRYLVVQGYFTACPLDRS